MKKKLLFLISEDSYFCSHRLCLAKAAKRSGFEVALATRCQAHHQQINAAGILLFPLKHFNRGGLNPWKQFLALKELGRIYKTYQPDVVHHVAIKPVLYGSLMAKWCHIPKVIHALGGLGYLFTETSKSQSFKKLNLKKLFLFQIVKKWYQWAFSQPNAILLLQNEDDKKLLIQHGCVKEEKVIVIAGSGIDTQMFSMKPFLPSPPVFITCVSRLLWDKGIGEYVSAAKKLHEQRLPVKFILYGLPDAENPASIPTEILKAWHGSQLIEWRGFCEDVAKCYAESHIAVLPSYREGLPKSLLEAASSGRPIVTSDVPGCREVVQDGVNGFLVKVQDAHGLAEKIRILVENEPLRIKMGLAGRKRVEDNFSNEEIHSKILKLYIH